MKDSSPAGTWLPRYWKLMEAFCELGGMGGRCQPIALADDLGPYGQRRQPRGRLHHIGLAHGKGEIAAEDDDLAVG